MSARSFLLSGLAALAAATPVPDAATASRALKARLYDYIFYQMPPAPIHDASADPAAAKTWQDPYGDVAKDSFTFVIEGDTLSMYTQAMNGSFAAGSFMFCDKGMPETVHGKADMVYARSQNLLHDRLYIHRGNSCRYPEHVTAQGAFDDDWVVWQHAFVNMATDPRCAACKTMAWEPNLSQARRCVLKKNTAPPAPKHSFTPHDIKFHEPIKGVAKPKHAGWKVPSFSSKAAPSPHPPKPSSAPPPPPPPSKGKAPPHPKPAVPAVPACVPPLCTPAAKGAPKAKAPNGPQPTGSAASNCVPPLCIPKA